MPSPVILHLLGTWQDSKARFEFPVRSDLFKGIQTASSRPSILVTQFTACSDNEHIHFPPAVTEHYPKSQPEQEIFEEENWEPLINEELFRNWDLNPEPPVAGGGGGGGAGAPPQPLTEEEEEEEGRRVRRQAPKKKTAGEVRAQELEDVAVGLEENEAYVNCYLQKPGWDKSFDNIYSRFAKALIKELKEKWFAPLHNAFQRIWASPSFSLTEIVANEVLNTFTLQLIVPPHCTLGFSDASVLQALGFDRFELPNNAGPKVRQHPRTPYVFVNDTNSRKVFVSDRPIENAMLSLLRGAAALARKKLPDNLKILSPEIGNVSTVSADGGLIVSVACNLPKISKSRLTFEIAESGSAISDLSDALRLNRTANFYKNLLKNLALVYGMDEAAFVVEQNLADSLLSLQRHAALMKPEAAIKDQLTVEFAMGRTVHQNYAAAAGLDRFFTWNLGIQSPLLIYVVKNSEAKAQAAENERLFRERQEAIEAEALKNKQKIAAEEAENEERRKRLEELAEREEAAALAAQERAEKNIALQAAAAAEEAEKNKAKIAAAEAENAARNKRLEDEQALRDAEAQKKKQDADNLKARAEQYERQRLELIRQQIEAADKAQRTRLENVRVQKIAADREEARLAHVERQRLADIADQERLEDVRNQRIAAAEAARLANEERQRLADEAELDRQFDQRLRDQQELADRARLEQQEAEDAAAAAAEDLAAAAEADVDPGAGDAPPIVEPPPPPPAVPAAAAPDPVFFWTSRRY